MRELARIDDLDRAWRTSGHGPRLRAVRAAAERLRDRFAAGPRVVAVRTLPLAQPIYTMEYGAAVAPALSPTLAHGSVTRGTVSHAARRR